MFLYPFPALIAHRKVPAWLRKQGLSSLPLISSYNDTLLSRSNAPSTSNGKPSAGFLADALFKSDKRPRPSDSYEDSNTEERETKRTKLKGKDPSSDENTEDAWPLGGDGSVALVGHGKWSSDDKTTEMDYLSTLKVFRVNLSNLRYGKNVLPFVAYPDNRLVRSQEERQVPNPHVHPRLTSE